MAGGAHEWSSRTCRRSSLGDPLPLAAAVLPDESVGFCYPELSSDLWERLRARTIDWTGLQAYLIVVGGYAKAPRAG